MSPAHQYKRLEKEVVSGLQKWLRQRWHSLLAFCKRVYQKGRQRFTVMLIPHSEKRIFNFQISFFTLIFVISLMGLVLVGFFVLATHFTGTNEQYVQDRPEPERQRDHADELQGRDHRLRKVGKDFKTSMEEVLSVVGTEDAANFLEKGVGGELTTLVSHGGAGPGQPAGLERAAQPAQLPGQLGGAAFGDPQAAAGPASLLVNTPTFGR